MYSMLDPLGFAAYCSIVQEADAKINNQRAEDLEVKHLQF